ncbi:hypothetical protein MMC15_006993 [Xylographa vitiligo]|nr:hypothetical protein [Xylographa vitiligo]
MGEVVVRDTSGRASTIWLPKTGTTVASLKQKVADQWHIAVKDQTLLFGGYSLEGSFTIPQQTNTIIDDSLLPQIIELYGFVIHLVISIPPASHSTPCAAAATTTTISVLENVSVSAPDAGNRTLNFTHVPVDCTIERFKQ